MRGILRTDRLLLRPAAATDTARLIAINEPAATDRISKLVENQLSWWRWYSYGLWLIILPTTEALAGWCGLRPGNSPVEPELLFGLAAGERKRGIATEAVRAVLAYALKLPNVHSVWAATAESNFASTEVMKRAGMSFEAQKELDGASMVLYRIRAPSRNVE